MKYRNSFIIAGFFIFITPFLGLPQSWKDIIFNLIGAGIITLGYLSSKNRSSHTS